MSDLLLEPWKPKTAQPIEAKLVADPGVLHATTDRIIAKRVLIDIERTKRMAAIQASKSVREILADATADVTAALTEFAQLVAAKKKAFADDIRANGALVIKKMDDDHAETQSAFAEMLGNEHAGVEADTKNG